MNKDVKYMIYCRQFANLHDDRVYAYDDFDSAKNGFKRAVKDYCEYLTKLGLHINKINYEGPRTEEEAKECLPWVTFITDDHMIFEVEMVEYGVRRCCEGTNE